MKIVLRILSRKWRQLLKVLFLISFGFVITTWTFFVIPIQQFSSENFVYEVKLSDLLKRPFTLKQDDPNLIEIIRKKFLQHPYEKKTGESVRSNLSLSWRQSYKKLCLVNEYIISLKFYGSAFL